jgi:hypothetical protein
MMPPCQYKYSKHDIEMKQDTKYTSECVLLVFAAFNSPENTWSKIHRADLKGYYMQSSTPNKFSYMGSVSSTV